MALAPAAFVSHEASYGAQVSLGLAFVRRRCGDVIDKDLSAKVLTVLAEQQATGSGIDWFRLPFVDDDGKWSLGELAAVALRFGSLAEWDQALQKATKKNNWGRIENVQRALRQFSLAELSTVFANRKRSAFGDSNSAIQSAFAIMYARDDAPEELLTTAEQLPESERNVALVRELYAVTAARRLIAMGKPVPTSFDEAMVAFQLIFFVIDIEFEFATAIVFDVLRAMPRDRVLAMVKRSLLNTPPQAVAALGAHFDATILEDVLAADKYIPAEYLGAIGEPAVEPLARAAQRATSGNDDSVRCTRYDGMLLAMGNAVVAGIMPPPAWDRWLEVGSVDGVPLKNWSPSETLKAALTTILTAMPAARRDQVLRAAMTASSVNVGPFVHLGSNALVDTRLVSQPESRPVALARVLAAAKSALPGAARERVYLVDCATDEQPARPGSLSRTGGCAPGLIDADIPNDSDGEPFAHLLTIDFDDVPELRSRFADARAVALFCADPDSWPGNEKTSIVAISAAAAKLAPNTGNGEMPVSFTCIDVPSEVFAEGEHDEIIDELRSTMFRYGAHILGRPFWIQEFDGDDDGFLIQVNDGLVPHLNLGDAGSLYVFDTGEAVFHCY